MLIGLTGKIKSGKDYLGGLLQTMARTDYDTPFILDSFASPLRQLVAILTGIPYERTLSQSQKEAPVLTQLIKPDNPVELFQKFFQSQSQNLYPEEKCQKLVDQFYQFLQEKNPSVGRTLQYLGTDLVRVQLDTEAWVKCLLYQWKLRGRPNMIVTDCRYPNELIAIKNENGFILRIKRYDSLILSADRSQQDSLNLQPNSQSSSQLNSGVLIRDSQHSSETALDTYPCFTVVNPMSQQLSEIVRPILVHLLIKSIN